ncbi:MAG: GUN4 domain-containing protein [Gomphosphaeria aponina SAG 52.96 = DSM 107014]|uniref:GUN4 domain-containing protein n=1 Tax=Gomphosphaeria aponina SAG 52.96 = DSM 107014 TaxID=1521640 RepID=A0A941GQZ1_9CHRO|nr:GUN4 domain-containing protein [Gomphosphaeria aponina SAG 52.96 = DSM 107014]
MSNNDHQPRTGDLVLGGDQTPPVNGAVLGGIEGVKHRLANPSEEVKLKTLYEALKYKQVGESLLYQILCQETGKIQQLAYYLLRYQLLAQHQQEEKAILARYEQERKKWFSSPNAAKLKLQKELTHIWQNYEKNKFKLNKHYPNFELIEPLDFSKLHYLLATEKWKEADRETYKLILKLANREDLGYLYIYDVDRIESKTELPLIDQLWLKYSKKRFGFSVQKKIYQKISGSLDGEDYNLAIKKKFGEAVGWRVNDYWLNCQEIHYDISAPEGHLPSLLFQSQRRSYTVMSVYGNAYVYFKLLSMIKF